MNSMKQIIFTEMCTERYYNTTPIIGFNKTVIAHHLNQTIRALFLMQLEHINSEAYSFMSSFHQPQNVILNVKG